MFPRLSIPAFSPASPKCWWLGISTLNPTLRLYSAIDVLSNRHKVIPIALRGYFHCGNVVIFFRNPVQ